MSVTARPIPPSAEREAAIPDVPIYRLSVEQYHAMARAGILDEDAPVELLEGWLVQKMTNYPPHVLAARLVRQALQNLISSRWFVASQDPITLADSEPEPDVAIVRGTLRDYRERHPGPQDVALVVEVADTSLRQDRGTKKRIYAGAGIGVYWIVNLKARAVEVYTEPITTGKGPDYAQRHNYGPDDELPLLLDSLEVGRIPVREFLP
jgi:Uma2 family endonuclease